MSITNGALQIGRTAVTTYQASMQVIGNNIANAGSTQYTRQNAQLSPIVGAAIPQGYYPGGGVEISALNRAVDEALESRIRSSISDQAFQQAVHDALARVETIYNEVGDNTLSDAMDAFFNAWTDVSAAPQDVSRRSVLSQAAVSLAQKINFMRDDLMAVRTDVNEQYKDGVQRVNEIADEIADFNRQIMQAENGGTTIASPLRDSRDALLRELGDLVDIQTRQQPTGTVNVYIGNQVLVQEATAREVKYELDSGDDMLLARAEFVDDGSQITITGGKLAGLASARDDSLAATQQHLNTLASTLIQQVNAIHASGQGLDGFSELTGEYAVNDTTAALNKAGLDATISNGSFNVVLTNTLTGISKTTQIKVDLAGTGADMSLDDLAAALNAVDNLSAAVTATGRLKVTSDASEYEFAFADDTSGALGALGMNAFFTGSSAATIAVHQDILSDPRRIAAAKNGLPGNGEAAQQIASLRDNGISQLNDMSMNDYYRGMVASLASDSASSRDRLDLQSSIRQALDAQRESISGVSMDEEAVNLMQAQYAFSGAARYITVLDSMIAEVLALVR